MNSYKKKRNVRKRIFEIIEVAEKGDYVSFIYDIVMISAILISLIPLAFKDPNPDDPNSKDLILSKIFYIIDIITACLYIMDYILRLITADYKLNCKSYKAFIRYPFTLWAIIDLLSILPLISLLDERLKMLRILTLSMRTFKIIRIFKTFRYSNSITIISNVIKGSKNALIAVCTLAFGYILTSALIIFNVEEKTFDSFFMAVYWATVSLTTVGYGDIYPTTTTGRVIAMISSLFGIALVALPSGIITAGYMESLSERKQNKDSSSVTLMTDNSTADITTLGRVDSFRENREI